MDSDDESPLDWRTVPLPKRGEKDFEPDGLTVQLDLLGLAIDSMFQALGLPRSHHPNLHVEAVWLGTKLVVPFPRGNYFRDVGTAGHKGILYLDAIETIYLCERGSLAVRLGDDQFTSEVENAESAELFRHVDTSRLPHLDLAMLYGVSGVDLDEYQVYGHLKRLGYLVRRWTLEEVTVPSKHEYHQLWWDYFLRFTSYYRFFVSLVRPHSPSITAANPLPQGFAVWKPTPNFKKRNPPPPQYHVVCILSHELFVDVNTIHSLALVSPGVPPRPVKPGKKPRRAPTNPMVVYNKNRDSKFRMGHSPTVYAVNNDGIMNFVTLAVGDFELIGNSDLEQISPGRFHGVMVK